MAKSIYSTNDSNCMNLEDLTFQQMTEMNWKPERINWSFDDFTGGRDCFSDNESYLKAKKWFGTYKTFVNKKEIKKIII